MTWLVLVVSGVFEAVWATALSRSDGLSRPTASAVFAVALVVSMTGLAYAMRTLPPGTSYAVWVGIGVALTVAYAMATGAEPASATRVALIVGVIGCVAGLKLAHGLDTMSEPTVTDVPEQHRYEISVDGVRAGVASYIDIGDQRDFHHTEVDRAFGGQGLGTELVAAALADTQAAGKRILPTCSFVVDYVAKHPEYAD